MSATSSDYALLRPQRPQRLAAHGLSEPSDTVAVAARRRLRVQAEVTVGWAPRWRRPFGTMHA